MAFWGGGGGGGGPIALFLGDEYYFEVHKI